MRRRERVVPPVTKPGASPLPLSGVRAHDGVMAELRRPQSGRIIGGVCAALAHRFGWDVTIVRIIAVLSILLPGPQVIAYIVGWVLIPGEQASTLAGPAQPTS